MNICSKPSVAVQDKNSSGRTFFSFLEWPTHLKGKALSLSLMIRFSKFQTTAEGAGRVEWSGSQNFKPPERRGGDRVWMILSLSLHVVSSAIGSAVGILSRCSCLILPHLTVLTNKDNKIDNIKHELLQRLSLDSNLRRIRYSAWTECQNKNKKNTVYINYDSSWRRGYLNVVLKNITTPRTSKWLSIALSIPHKNW